jgi:hypothetical protein
MVGRTFVLVAGSILLGGACKAPEVETPHYANGLFPQVAHSGFNEKTTFKVLFATGASDAQWAVADPTMATIAASDPPTIAGTDVSDLHFALVTVTKGGQTTVTMTSGGTTLTAQLQAPAYTDDQLAVGKARYETPSTDAARPPCLSCHVKDGGIGADHSPLTMAGFDDATILGVIQNATFPPSPTGQSTTSAFAPRGPLAFTGHKWNLSDAEKVGIVAYLRSLPLGGR